MAKSPFFARIKIDVLKLVSSIPKGKCSTYKSIGEHLDVVPRHVAYILSSLSDSEKATYPWYRVVGIDGLLGQPKVSEFGNSQSVLLRGEGLLVANNRVDTTIDSWFVHASELESGISKQIRPADAPRMPSKKSMT